MSIDTLQSLFIQAESGGSYVGTSCYFTFARPSAVMSVKAPEAGPSTKRVKLDTEKEATANSSAASDADEAVSEAGSDEASDSGFSSDVQDEFPDEDLESVDEADEEDEEEDSETEDIKEANARKQGLIKNSSTPALSISCYNPMRLPCLHA